MAIVVVLWEMLREQKSDLVLFWGGDDGANGSQDRQLFFYVLNMPVEFDCKRPPVFLYVLSLMTYASIPRG